MDNQGYQRRCINRLEIEREASRRLSYHYELKIKQETALLEHLCGVFHYSRSENEELSQMVEKELFSHGETLGVCLLSLSEHSPRVSGYDVERLVANLETEHGDFNFKALGGLFDIFDEYLESKSSI